MVSCSGQRAHSDISQLLRLARLGGHVLDGVAEDPALAPDPQGVFQAGDEAGGTEPTVVVGLDR